MHPAASRHPKGVVEACGEGREPGGFPEGDGEDNKGLQKLKDAVIREIIFKQILLTGKKQAAPDVSGGLAFLLLVDKCSNFACARSQRHLR